MEPRTDTELVAASRGGDRAAFGELVGRCARMVEAVSYARTRDRALCEDISQDTFVTAWRDLHRLRDASSVRPWLCTIARNLAHKARRRARREVVVPDEQIGEATDHRTAFEAASDDQMDRVLGAALERIPVIYREALVLFYFEQQSTRQVAAALGVAESVVHKRLSRGRAHLAEVVRGAVEGQLAKRRRTRDLAALVLAALPVAASASRVDAAPRRAASWTGAAIAVVAAVTVGAVAARPSAISTHAGAAPPSAPRASRTPVAAAAPPSAPRAPAPPVAAAAPPSAPRASRTPAPSLPAAAPSVSARAAAPGRAPRGGGTPAPCDAIARHVVEVSLTRFRAAASDRAAEIDEAIEDVADECRDDRWTAAEIACIAASADEVALARCRPDRTPPAQDAAPPALVAPDVDVACASVGGHVAELMIDSMQGTREDNVAARVLVDAGALRVQVREACAREAWSHVLRRCFAAATRFEHVVACRRAYDRV